MRLEQSSSLLELPRESVAFLDITRGTGEHKIGNVIGWDISSSHAVDRKCVINVIDIFPIVAVSNSLKFFLTIIAFVSLPFQHFLDLLCGMCAWDTSFTDPSIMRVDSSHNFTAFCLVVARISHFGFFEMCPVVFPMLYYVVLSLTLVIQFAYLTAMRFICLMILLFLLRYSFLVDLIVYLVILLVIFLVAVIPCLFSHKSFISYLWQHAMFSSPFVLAGDALIVKTKCLSLITVKEIWRQRINLFASGASFMPLGYIRWFRWFASTLLAIKIQAISSILVFVEELRCGGISVRTLRTLLLWDGIRYSVHDISPIQMYPASSCSLQRGGKPLFTSSNYTINQPEKPEEAYLW